MGDGHTHGNPMFGGRPTGREPMNTLLGLANNYDTAGAHAFRSHKDEEAKAFRDAANQLRQLAETLPPLPGRQPR